ncbi:hypothetical protein [Thermotoga sp. KOL6]|uniref:hypothetical protein n=1 Tax=Thermotoga sp. KOL6 TaxID=126741 RepID=UPI000C7904C4|nr:hypothetical protein [Thermotoga sp. KOL6]PLV58380.1 hypothetical protein AS005_08430 [Thermotoga sp. KOL6]
MIRPIDFQGFVVKGVESVQNVSQILNQQALMQQITEQHLIQRFTREQQSVKESDLTEGTKMKTSTEGERKREFQNYRANTRKRKTILKEENKGLFLDVRT